MRDVSNIPFDHGRSWATRVCAWMRSCRLWMTMIERDTPDRLHMISPPYIYMYIYRVCTTMITISLKEKLNTKTFPSFHFVWKHFLFWDVLKYWFTVKSQSKKLFYFSKMSFTTFKITIFIAVVILVNIFKEGRIEKLTLAWVA